MALRTRTGRLVLSTETRDRTQFPSACRVRFDLTGRPIRGVAKLQVLDTHLPSTLAFPQRSFTIQRRLESGLEYVQSVDVDTEQSLDTILGEINTQLGMDCKRVQGDRVLFQMQQPVVTGNWQVLFPERLLQDEAERKDGLAATACRELGVTEDAVVPNIAGQSYLAPCRSSLEPLPFALARVSVNYTPVRSASVQGSDGILTESLMARVPFQLDSTLPEPHQALQNSWFPPVTFPQAVTVHTIEIELFEPHRLLPLQDKGRDLSFEFSYETVQ